MFTFLTGLFLKQSVATLDVAMVYFMTLVSAHSSASVLFLLNLHTMLPPQKNRVLEYLTSNINRKSDEIYYFSCCHCIDDFLLR